MEAAAQDLEPIVTQDCVLDAVKANHEYLVSNV
jgi:hypothetical protein